MDASIVADKDGQLTAHKVDCPDVRKLADAGVPVMHMIDFKPPLPNYVKLHSCLTEKPDVPQ